MRTLTLPLALLAGCSAALASPYTDLALSPTAEARAQGPGKLAEMLAQYDRMAPGTERDAFALAIDEVAGQRYATVSRLYWYTDLPAAEAEAHRRHLPILSLRMLGRLDQDLSCANSRLFRATLYANADVSQFLRDHFVLHWSSERPVPRVTIDFGDGRKLERTTTGNSAHYVLDEDGHVLDVLPGVYAPLAFRKELTASFDLAHRMRNTSPEVRADRVATYQRALLGALDQARHSVAGATVIPGKHRLLTSADILGALALAQRATMSKAYIEVPDLERFGYAPGGTAAPDDVAAWVTAGQRLYGIGDLPSADAAAQVAGYLGPTPAQAQAQAKHPPATPHVLDAQSRALIERLHDDVPPELRATPAQLAEMLDRLEEHVVADTALNQLTLRPQIASYMAQHPGVSFDELNAWIYAEVFKTPRGDAWLGLLPRTDFTGLPGDGIATP